MIYSRIIQIIIIAAFVSVYNFGSAQNNIEYFSKADSVSLPAKSNIADVQNKFHYGLTTGASVLVGSGKSVFSQVYTAPYFGYAVNSKLTINTGFLVTNSTFNGNTQSGESVNFLPQNVTQNYVFLQGVYKLNDDVTLYGSGYYNLNKIYGKENNSLFNFDSKGYSFGIDYKIAQHANIGLEFQYNKNPNHFNALNFNNPFQNNITW